MLLIAIHALLGDYHAPDLRRLLEAGVTYPPSLPVSASDASDEIVTGPVFLALLAVISVRPTGSLSLHSNRLPLLGSYFCLSHGYTLPLVFLVLTLFYAPILFLQHRLSIAEMVSTVSTALSYRYEGKDALTLHQPYPCSPTR